MLQDAITFHDAAAVCQLATNATNGYSFPMTGMTYRELLQRFTEAQEIGRELSDTQLTIYFDNGEHVGRWLENRRTTQGYGELIPDEHAATARHWCRRLRQKERDANAQATECRR
jgi:hypothetical protein